MGYDDRAFYCSDCRYRTTDPERSRVHAAMVGHRMVETGDADSLDNDNDNDGDGDGD